MLFSACVLLCFLNVVIACVFIVNNFPVTTEICLLLVQHIFSADEGQRFDICLTHSKMSLNFMILCLSHDLHQNLI